MSRPFAKSLPNPRYPPLPCDDEKTFEEYVTIKSSISYDDYVYKWALFYLGHACVPTYVDTFVGAVDNPDATQEHAMRFANITLQHYILPTNWQPYMPGSQREYLNYVAIEDEARMHVEWLNQKEGIVAFASKNNVSSIGPYVTYEDYDGTPIPLTIAGPNSEDMEMIRASVSSANEWNLTSVCIISTMPKDNYILDVMEEMPSADYIWKTNASAIKRWCKKEREKTEKEPNDDVREQRHKHLDHKCGKRSKTPSLTTTEVVLGSKPTHLP